MIRNRFHPFWVFLIDSVAIMRDNDFHLCDATLAHPVFVRRFLTPMSSIEYEYRIPFFDVFVVAELLKSFDYLGLCRMMIEYCDDMALGNAQPLHQIAFEFLAIWDSPLKIRMILIHINADDEGK